MHNDMRKWVRLIERVFHGSPHDVTQFDTRFIGTGQGANSYGYGLYFAGARNVAIHYRDLLAPKAGRQRTLDWPAWLRENSTVVFPKIEQLFSDKSLRNGAMILWNAIGGGKLYSFTGGVAEAVEACRRFDLKTYGTTIEDIATVAKQLYRSSTGPHPGVLYTVEIPNSAKFLLWDKSVAAQAQPVKRAMDALLPAFKTDIEKAGGSLRKTTGKTFYKTLTKAVGTPKAASLALLEKGVHGIKYLDAASRGRDVETKTFNYVVFDGAFATIVAQEGI